MENQDNAYDPVISSQFLVEALLGWGLRFIVSEVLTARHWELRRLNDGIDELDSSPSEDQQSYA
jgi:hypothetical protein